jgi:hypothetical protein
MLKMRKLKNQIITLFVIVLIVNITIVYALGEGFGGGFGAGLGGLGSQEGSSGFQQALQAVQQVMAMVKEIMGNVQATLEANAKAENERLGKLNLPRLPEATDPSAGGTPEIKDLEVDSNSAKGTFSNAEITFVDLNNGNKFIIENRPNKTSSFDINKTLDNLKTNATTTLVTKEGTDLAVVRVGDQTTIIDQGGAETANPIPYNEGNTNGSNSQSNSQSTSQSNSGVSNGFLPLVSASEPIQQTFVLQRVLFTEKNIEMSGYDILLFPLKNYNEVSVIGSKLRIANGDVDIEFENGNTYYSREMKKSDYFMNKLSNGLDNKNYFRLLQDGANGNYLIDGKKITTVGDRTVNNPMQGYEGLIIPKAREAMWKKAADRV